MSMSMNVAAFVKTVADSGILSFDSLDAYLRNPEIAHDSSAFAERLVQDGLLTGYQTKRIAGGESDALLIGPYVVLDVLGTGGMGCVYRAEHRAMRRSVALKVIAQHKLGNPEMVQHFGHGAGGGAHAAARPRSGSGRRTGVACSRGSLSMHGGEAARRSIPVDGRGPGGSPSPRSMRSRPVPIRRHGPPSSAPMLNRRTPWA